MAHPAHAAAPPCYWENNVLTRYVYGKMQLAYILLEHELCRPSPLLEVVVENHRHIQCWLLRSLVVG